MLYPPAVKDTLLQTKLVGMVKVDTLSPHLAEYYRLGYYEEPHNTAGSMVLSLVTLIARTVASVLTLFSLIFVRI